MAVAEDPKRAELLAAAEQLAKLAAGRDEYGLLCALAQYEKDKPGALTLLRDFNCLAAAVLREPGICPLPAVQAGRAILRADEACAALTANGSPKLVLTNLAVRLAHL